MTISTNSQANAPLNAAPVDRANHPVEPEVLYLTEPFENGYHFPPKYSFKVAFKHGLEISWRFVSNWKGFLITVYGLNVVAWGGMLFLLLCNASPAMCVPDCDDKDRSPRQIWLEIDSQILNALFCLLAWGLAPWRFRDLYYLMRYRIKGEYDGLRHLAGIYRGWFRLPDSSILPVDVGPTNIPEGTPSTAIPLPETKIPDAPLSGTRAPPTAIWKLDTIIWLFVSNTILQVGLAAIMWGMNKYNRPSAATGVLVGAGCVVAIIAGQMMGSEGSSVKAIEGIPLTAEDEEKLKKDKQEGILHYNNKKDKRPKAKKGGSQEIDKISA